MADTKDNAKDDKMMDVAKPTAVPKRALMTETPADPDDETTITESTKTQSVPSTSKVKIEPISAPEDLKPEKKPSPDDSPDDGAVNDKSQNEGRDKLKDASQDEQELIDKKAAEHQANIDKIAMAKTYYLPINQVERRRSKNVVIIGAVLIVILGLAWVDVSLDAGLISIPGVKAPTHFFSK